MYGLGGVLWRIVSGGHRPQQRLVPVDAPSRMWARFRGQVDPQPLARELGAGRLSNWVLAAIDRCLELEPKDRPEDCWKLLALLRGPAREDLVQSGYTDEGEEEYRREERGFGGEAETPTRYGIEQGGSTRASAERGDASAQWQLGEMYYRGEGVPEDVALAMRWYEKAAEQGDASAQICLGRMYRAGEGVSRDDSLALGWYRKAAEQGPMRVR